MNGRSPDEYVERRIRVLQIITRLAARGAPRHVLDLAERLDPERFEVDILTGTPEPEEGDLREEALERGLRVFVVEEMVRSISPIQDVRALVKIRRLLRLGNYDVVHTHISKSGVLGRRAARSTGVPVVVQTYHGAVKEVDNNRVLLWAERRAARWADVLIAVSQSAMKHQLAMGIGERYQYRVIHNGIDLQRFQPTCHSGARASISGRGPVIGTVGSLTKEKGTEDLIAATARLRDRFPELHLCVVGDGKERDALVSQVKDFGLTDRVWFTGNVGDVRDWLAAFDVFVQPSHSEGMGRALLEAMAMGRPVVASRTGGIPELVGDTGLLVEVGEIDELSDAINQVLSNEELRKDMATRGRIAAGGFSLEQMAQQTGKLYDEMLGRFDSKRFLSSSELERTQ